MEWINDGTCYCEQCNITFKVYVVGEELYTQFCPGCGSREIEGIDE